MNNSALTYGLSGKRQPRLLLSEGIDSLAWAIADAKRRGRMTPAIVSAYSALVLQNDSGYPIAPAAHHSLWLALACDERIKKLLIISPPESAKTTWLLTAYLSCRIGFHPDHNVIIGSVSDDVAIKRSIALRNIIQGDTWRGLFPSVQPVASMEWGQKSWSLAERGIPLPGRIHATLTAYGTGASITGSRADLLIGDDLLDFDNTRTKHQRDLVDAWLHNSFLSRRKSRVGRVILIGTAWNADDSYTRIRKMPLGWVVCHTASLAEASENGFYAYLTYPDDWAYERLGEPVAESEIQA